MKLKTFEDCCNEVAIKHKLGKTLVTGHRASYFAEAAHIFAEQFKEAKRVRAPITDEERVRLVNFLTTRFTVDEINELTSLLRKDNCSVEIKLT